MIIKIALLRKAQLQKKKNNSQFLNWLIQLSKQKCF